MAASTPTLTLTINGRTVTAQPDQTILDAARAGGIADIPTLCWYPKLPIVGNCRICLVSVEGQAKLLPACATKVAGGMVVQTESHAAVENRKGVLRLLLERYPGDHLLNGGRARPRNAPAQIRHPDKVVRSVCPYCGVGCQVDLHVADNKVLRVTSPDIELDTPNQGSTCVKGRFGYDFPQHRDRLTKPLIRKAWVKEGGRWVWRGPTGVDRRGGPWQTIEGEGQNAKPAGPPRSAGKSLREMSLLERIDLDIRDRVATPPAWYEPFREATWDEAMELTAQELLRLKRAHGGDALACFSSAKCSNEENYLLMRLFRAALGTNNIDHCTRLCHSTSVAAMQRALHTSAASGSMREVEHAADVIFIAGANTTESHPVFGAAIKRAHERGATLVVADPRRTELAGRADIHLQMQPGTDVALFSAMLNHILARGLEASGSSPTGRRTSRSCGSPTKR